MAMPGESGSKGPAIREKITFFNFKKKIRRPLSPRGKALMAASLQQANKKKEKNLTFTLNLVLNVILFDTCDYVKYTLQMYNVFICIHYTGSGLISRVYRSETFFGYTACTRRRSYTCKNRKNRKLKKKKVEYAISFNFLIFRPH